MVAAWSDEEGRYAGLFGSSAFSGKLDAKQIPRLHAADGERLVDAMARAGFNAYDAPKARCNPKTLSAYVELHIEQGPHLEAAKIPIGVVEGIVGIREWDVTVEGFANHAGTTPMNRRHDALVSAAELTLAINRVATTLPGRQVATVGRIHAEPGARNVVPGRVVMGLEIRDLAAEKMQQVYDAIEAEAKRIAKAHETPISFAEIDVAAAPAPTDERMRRIIADAATALGLTHKLMPSGAGHDAQDMTHIAPTGMIFVPSVGGISHSPKEYTSPRDMANGTNVLLQTLLAIDRGALN